MMIIAGFVQLLIPSTIHLIMGDFHLGEGVAGLLPLVFFAGIIISALLVTRLLENFSVKALVVSGALLVSASLVAASVTPWFALFVFFYFFAGLGNGSLIILPGMYATSTCGDETPRVQSMLFGFLSCGYIVGPFVPGIIENLEISWRWAVAVPGLLVIPFVIPVVIARLKRLTEVERISFKFIKEIVSFDRRFFVGLVIALIFAAGAALGLITWLVTFLEQERGMTRGTAHLVLAGLGVALLVGRLTCAHLARRFSAYKILLLLTPLAAVLTFLAPLPDSTTANVALFLLSALVYAGTYPLLLSAAKVYPKSQSSGAYTLLFIAMSVGGLAMTYCIGQIFQHLGAVVGMSSAAAMFIIVLAFLLALRREIPLSEHAHQKAFPV